MPFNVPFCTITSYSSIEYGNDKISDGTLSNPYTLKITSLSPALYPITPSDFRVIGAIQSGFGAAFYDTIQGHPEIEKVEFVQSFDNVDVCRHSFCCSYQGFVQYKRCPKQPADRVWTGNWPCGNRG